MCATAAAAAKQEVLMPSCCCYIQHIHKLIYTRVLCESRVCCWRSRESGPLGQQPLLYATRHVRLGADSSFLYGTALTLPVHPRVGGHRPFPTRRSPPAAAAPTVVDRSKLLDRWPPPQPLPLSDCAKCSLLAGWLARSLDAGCGGCCRWRRRCMRAADAAGCGAHQRARVRRPLPTSTRGALVHPVSPPSHALIALAQRRTIGRLGLPQGFNQGFPVVKPPHAY